MNLPFDIHALAGRQNGPLRNKLTGYCVFLHKPAGLAIMTVRLI